MIAHRPTAWFLAFGLILLLCAVPSAQSAAVIQLTPTVTPVSVTPGGSGAISLVLKNAGNVTAYQLETRVTASDAPIKVNQTGTIALGGIAALETTTLTPFTFTVARDAAPGIYRVDATLDFRYLDGATTRYSNFAYSAPIIVRATGTLLVEGITPDRIEPGSDVAATIKIANTGTSEYLNIAGSWSSVQNTVLPLGGSNQFQIASIGPNSSAEVPVRLAAGNGALPGLYAITFKLAYVDAAGNLHNTTSMVGLWLGSGTGTDLSVNIQNITDDTITVAVTNVGLKGLTGVQVRLVPLEGIVLEDSDTTVLGNILPGEFRTATYDIDRIGPKAAARADVEYTDSLGQRRSASEPLTFEAGTVTASTSNAVVAVVTALALLGVQGVIGLGWLARRRFAKRKETKETQEEADFAALARQAQQDTSDLGR